MGLKYKRTLYRATWFTVVVVTISLAIQVYLKKWQSQIDLLVPVQESDTLNTPILTVWDIIKSDGNVSVFAKMVGEFDDIVGGLKVPQAKFTVYAPTNEAFKKEEFEHDLPLFYYQFLVGHHMGPGVYSAEALSTTNTVPTFVNADIFFKYRQRISTQIESGTCSLNRKARLVQPNIAAVNGIVHHIDRVLMLPDSTADILRNWPEFSTMRRGLIQSGLAVTINDTSTHVGQTLFVPSDAAFEKLGPKVNKFLFSPWGNRYLEALLKYHVVANRTLFSDVYFQANGKGQIASKEGSEFDLPTLCPKHNISAALHLQNQRLSIELNDAVRIDQADIVVMDGVVHGIESVLLPPSYNTTGRESRKCRWFDFLWDKAGSGTMTVDEFMERLQPLVDDTVK